MLMWKVNAAAQNVESIMSSIDLRNQVSSGGKTFYLI